MNSQVPNAPLEEFLAADDATRASMLEAKDLHRVLEGLEATITIDATKAIRAARLISETAGSIDAASVAARALRAGATASAYLGNNDESLEMTREARTIATSGADAVEAARALVAGMHPLCKSGQLDKAISDGQQARSELLEAGETLLAARVDLNLGNVLKNTGDAEGALEHLARVITVLPDDDPIRPHAINAIGDCHFVLDDLAAADTAFSKVVELLGENGGLATAIAMGNRADVAAREGRIQDALDLFATSREHCQSMQAGNHVARLMVESAEALETGGLHDEARSELEQALPELEKHGLAYEAARARFALGRLSLKDGKYKIAVEQLNQAYRQYNELGNTRQANRVMLAAAEGYLAAGQLDEAAIRINLVSATVDGTYDEILLAHHQGLLQEAMGNFEAALSAAEHAEKLGMELGIRPLLVDLATRRSTLLRKTGSIDEAITVGREASEAADMIRSGIQARRLRAAFLASRMAAHEAYVAALLETGDSSRIRQAFEIAERARNRNLLERISQQLTDGGTDRQDPEIAELRRRLNALYASLAQDGMEDQRRLRSNQRQAEIDRLEIQLDRKLLDIERSNPVTDSPISLEEIERAMGSDTALIEYFAISDDLIVFTLVSGKLEFRVLPGAGSRAEELIGELHFQCRRRLRGEPGPQVAARMLQSTRNLLRELHELLIRPLPEEIRTSPNWLVVPHGALVSMPFHALLDDDTCLMDRICIATAPSAAVAVRLGESVDRGRGTLVATVSDELAPAIQEEGLAVAELHQDVTRIHDEEVTAERLLKELSAARIAHVACHGRFLSGSPRSSGLRLADRWLTVRDIHEMDSAPEIVILSGCETGLNPGDGANELLGLTRGFVAGGSRAVVASLWSVHDTASTRLMTNMHKQLAASVHQAPLQVAEALRSAQISLREERPHPAFWAPFFCAECPASLQNTRASRGHQGVLQR